MTSPLAARWRLAADLRRLRDQAGLTSAQLARAAGLVRQKVSALENAHVPVSVTDVCRVLDALGADDDQWRVIVDTAGAAAGVGWWETTGAPAELPFVDLETGAASVSEYQRLLVPAALQTTPYACHRAGLHGDPGHAAETLRIRQRLLLVAGGADYEVVIEEAVLRRPAVPDEVMAEQLR